MSDDEFEELCKSIEEASETSANETVIENPAAASAKVTTAEESKAEDAEDDEDDALKLIDSFLEETVDFRKNMFSEEDFKSSTPKQRKPRSVFSETEDLWKKIEKYQQLSVSTSDETRPVSSARADGSPVSSVVKDEVNQESIVLAGNLYDGDGVELDYSLLDQDEWDDDIQELTVDQILQDIALLDSDSEEDDVEEDRDKTVVAVEPEKQEPKPKPVEKPKKPKINVRDIKNIDVKYYRELEEVYDRYRDHKNIGQIPTIQAIRKPRVFKDRAGNIIGFDSLDEYIDNNHPLWCDLRLLFYQYLNHQKTAYDMSDFIHKQWKSGHDIDINQNLTCFPRKIWKNSQGRVARDKGQGALSSQACKIDAKPQDKKEQLVAMYKSAVETEGLRQKEEERFQMYKSYQGEVEEEGEEEAQVAEEEEEEKRQDCGFCFQLCLCSGGQKQAAGKRKLEQGNQQQTKRQKTAISDHIETILKTMKLTETEKCANVIRSVQESYELSCHYSPEPWSNPEMVKELVSLEAVYTDFDKYYSSPYAKDNPVEEKGQDSTLSYTKFIEDY